VGDDGALRAQDNPPPANLVLPAAALVLDQPRSLKAAEDVVDGGEGQAGVGGEAAAADLDPAAVVAVAGVVGELDEDEPVGALGGQVFQDAPQGLEAHRAS
jgi:hypothetical protein